MNILDPDTQMQPDQIQLNSPNKQPTPFRGRPKKTKAEAKKRSGRLHHPRATKQRLLPICSLTMASYGTVGVPRGTRLSATSPSATTPLIVGRSESCQVPPPHKKRSSYLTAYRQSQARKKGNGDYVVGLAFLAHLVTAFVIMAIMLYQLDLGSETLTKQYTVSLQDMRYV